MNKLKAWFLALSFFHVFTMSASAASSNFMVRSFGLAKGCCNKLVNTLWVAPRSTSNTCARYCAVAGLSLLSGALLYKWGKALTARRLSMYTFMLGMKYRFKRDDDISAGAIDRTVGVFKTKTNFLAEDLARELMKQVSECGFPPPIFNNYDLILRGAQDMLLKCGGRDLKDAFAEIDRKNYNYTRLAVKDIFDAILKHSIVEPQKKIKPESFGNKIKGRIFELGSQFSMYLRDKRKQRLAKASK